jgi:hypothetical protein
MQATKLSVGEVRKLNKELAPEGLKFCNTCGTVKPFSEFNANKSGSSGLQNKCRDCDNATSNKWNVDNRDRCLERKRSYNRVYNSVRLQGGRDESLPWPSGFVSYDGSHKRVYATYGPASNNECQMCEKQATSWGYSHLDPDVFEGPVEDSRSGQVRIVQWSGDPRFYMALCHVCHTALDIAMAVERQTAVNGQ